MLDVFESFGCMHGALYRFDILVCLCYLVCIGHIFLHLDIICNDLTLCIFYIIIPILQVIV